jgi:carbamoyl-phosphate synthase large subunit
MGIGKDYGEAFAKAQLGAGQSVRPSGTAFLSVRDADKPRLVPLAHALCKQEFSIVATGGTADYLTAAGVACTRVNKVLEGRPHTVDKIKNGEIDFIINTTEGGQAIADSYMIRRSAIQYKVCYVTTIAGAEAACLSLQHDPASEVVSLQDRLD